MRFTIFTEVILGQVKNDVTWVKSKSLTYRARAKITAPSRFIDTHRNMYMMTSSGQGLWEGQEIYLTLGHRYEKSEIYKL